MKLKHVDEKKDAKAIIYPDILALKYKSQSRGNKATLKKAI